MVSREKMTTKNAQQPNDEGKNRFQIVKLEERIAPRPPTPHGGGGCHYNPQGKLVGC